MIEEKVQEGNRQIKQKGIISYLLQPTWVSRVKMERLKGIMFQTGKRENPKGEEESQTVTK